MPASLRSGEMITIIDLSGNHRVVWGAIFSGITVKLWNHKSAPNKLGWWKVLLDVSIDKSPFQPENAHLSIFWLIWTLQIRVFMINIKFLGVFKGQLIIFFVLDIFYLLWVSLAPDLIYIRIITVIINYHFVEPLAKLLTAQCREQVNSGMLGPCLKTGPHFYGYIDIYGKINKGL